MSTAIKTITFQVPTIDDKPKLSRYFDAMPDYGCEFTFANMLLWSHYYQAEYSVLNDMLVVRSGSEGQKSFSFPIGAGDAKAVIELLIQECRDTGTQFRMHSIDAKRKEQMEAWFPELFEFTFDRDSSDYIYDAEALITLRGKKYHGKRNHINRFKEEHPDWRYEPITEDNMEDCLKMAAEWCKANGCDDEGRLAEYCVIKNSFRHFDTLGLSGGAIRMDGEIIAFSLGEKLNDDVFVVHIEKAYSDINGAYPIINQEFASREAVGYKYINREEDLGIEGLRKAKLSYKPAILLEKFTAELAD